VLATIGLDKMPRDGAESCQLFVSNDEKESISADSLATSENKGLFLGSSDEPKCGELRLLRKEVRYSCISSNTINEPLRPLLPSPSMATGEGREGNSKPSNVGVWVLGVGSALSGPTGPGRGWWLRIGDRGALLPVYTDHTPSPLQVSIATRCTGGKSDSSESLAKAVNGGNQHTNNDLLLHFHSR
jgi:hypothetical protein